VALPDALSKILVVLPNNLGDVIMATPVMEGLAKKYPKAHVMFFCEEGYEAGMQNNPFCSRIVTFPRKKIRECLGQDWHKGRDLCSRCVDDVAGYGLDTVINLSQQNHVSFLVTLFSGKNVKGQQFLRQGNHSIDDMWSQYLYAIPFARSCNNLHAADVYRRIAGVKSHCGGYSLFLTDGEKKWAKKYLSDRGFCAGKKTMAFQPGAAFPSKRWPEEYFVRLGALLCKDGWRILVTGAPVEREQAAAIAARIGNGAVAVAGDTAFRQSMALVSQCGGCVTGDTAQMHASAGFDVPTYALFGPTNPVETGPYGNGHMVFSGRCGSMPCFKSECGSLECMKSILPEDVYACISGGSCRSSCSCNAYTTALAENGDYSLAPLRPDMHRYFLEGAVCLVRNIIDDRWNCVPCSADYAHGVAEAGRWQETVSDMCNALVKYEKSRDAKHISVFEVLKKSLDGMTSVGAFCTAMLNIRLNSIPLLSPLDAVRQSIDVCWKTHKQVGKAIS
jgi:ADP-heptose:LPS heptosyltransferase